MVFKQVGYDLMNSIEKGGIARDIHEYKCLTLLLHYDIASGSWHDLLRTG
jgi:hypothetical protein